MSIDAQALARHFARFYDDRDVAALVADASEEGYARYRDDPVGFAREVLDVRLTDDQTEIIRGLPGRVKMEAGHGLGKSFLMAVIVLWWFYTRDPSVVVCNAPKLEHLRDVLWSEIRMLWMRANANLREKGWPELENYFAGPKAPEMYDHPDHWAKGYTTSKSESYQGRHRENMLFIFDEDEGIEAVYWTATSTMYQHDQGHGWVCSCNPVTTSSQSFLESQATDLHGKPKWKLYTLSSLNHPNIQAQLRGEKPVIPNAVTIDQVDQWVKDWCTAIPDERDRQENDFEWRPGSGKWYRPGPIFKARALGLRPTEGIDTVWSQDIWKKAITPKWSPQECWERGFGISLACDSAGFGDDDTAIHVRCGPLSLHHETHNGWGPDKAAGKIKELCSEWSFWYNSLASFNRPPLTPYDVRVTLEFDGGYGIGVHSHREEFTRWHGVNVGSASYKLDPNGRFMYANTRAEVWFESALCAKEGRMDLSRLSPDVLERLRVQLTTPFYEIKPDGSRLVEPKKDVKERLGRSPDDADALILCYHQPMSWAPVVVGRGDE